MRQLSFALVIALFSASPSLAVAQQGGLDSAQVRTSATARRDIRPDQASFTLQFTADGRTPAEAGQRLAARADSVRRALMALGIPRDSMVTGSGWYWWPQRIQVLTAPRLIPYNTALQVNREPVRGATQAMDTVLLSGGRGMQIRPAHDTTYRAREMLRIRLAPNQVGPAIDAALALGVLEISSIQFSASTAAAVRMELLREATLLASEQAAAIAEGGGGRLGRVLYLGTEAPDTRRFGFEAVTTGVAAGVITSSSPGTEVIAPSVTVTVTVYGQWLLTPR